ncbi:MAG: hypothetical protein ACRCXZ_10570 [Patescibacteria group bacterium]
MTASFHAGNDNSLICYTKISEPINGYSDYCFSKGNISFVCNIHFRNIKYVLNNFDTIYGETLNAA